MASHERIAQIESRFSIAPSPLWMTASSTGWTITAPSQPVA